MNNEQFLPDEYEEAIQRSLQSKASRNTTQVNPKEWKNIMNESISLNKQLQNRSKLVAVAASLILLLAAISAFTITKINGSSSNVKTVDKRKNEVIETSTTIPDSPQRVDSKLYGKLLQLAPIRATDSNGYEYISNFEIYNTETKELVAKIAKPAGAKKLSIARLTRQAISFTSYDDNGLTGNNFTYLVAENKVIETGYATRVYSPNNSQYINFPKGLNPVEPGTVTLVKGKTERNLRPEGTLSISNVFWFNENEILMSVPTDGELVDYRFANLQSPISIATSKVVFAQDPETALFDAIEINGQKFVLTGGILSNDSYSYMELTATNIDTKKDIWKFNSGPMSESNYREFEIIAKFQGSQNVLIYNDGSQALTKNFVTDFILQPNTSYLFSIHK
ncbi:MAG: hypothetical protein U0R17_02260 [Acidimicrobiia bacterium]